MFSSEPIFDFANRFEPTDQRAVSNRADLSGRRVPKFCTLDTPVKPTARTNARFVERFVARDVAWCHTPTHDQSPPLSAAQPACHNSRLPSSPSAIVAQSSSSAKKPLKRSMTFRTQSWRGAREGDGGRPTASDGRPKAVQARQAVKTTARPASAARKASEDHCAACFGRPHGRRGDAT